MRGQVLETFPCFFIMGVKTAEDFPGNVPAHRRAALCVFLDGAQSPADYRAALTELRDILNLAQSRPQGWASQQGAAAAKAENMPTVGVVEGGYRFLGGDPASPKSWEKVQ